MGRGNRRDTTRAETSRPGTEVGQTPCLNLYTVFFYTCSEIYQAETAGTTQAEFIITYRAPKSSTQRDKRSRNKVDNSINSWRRSYLTACTLNIKKRRPATGCICALYLNYYIIKIMITIIIIIIIIIRQLYSVGAKGRW